VLSAAHLPRAALRGRAVERAALDAILESVRAGRSAAIVLRGEAGIGTTALLSYVASRADGCRPIRASRVQAEMELPFAALHQLCMPLLQAGLQALPGPQHEALATAFGLSAGRPPERFPLALAVLTLLAAAAESKPMICLVDDAQWLDRSSKQVLSFVARRLEAESILVVFAERDDETRLRDRRSS
jgi:predicted ATPase